MSEQSELLGKLKIDRSAQNGGGGSKKWIFLTALFFLTSAYLSYKLLSYQPFMPDKNPPEVTSHVSPKNRSAQETVSQAATTIPKPSIASAEVLNASGYITARRLATVSAEITGLITEVLVEEGMRVEKGQILARLDDTIARVNLDSAKAQIRVTTSQIKGTAINLKEAERVLARVSKLNSSEFSSEANLTRARANVENLKTSLAAQRAQQDVLKLDIIRQLERLNDHTIRAPFTGVVTVKNAQPGEIISPVSAGGGFTRTGICTIVDMNSLEIEVDVNEAFIGRVFAGQRVKANLDAYPNWDIAANVIAIIPTADRAKATVRIRIAIENKDTRILPDMGVKVAFLKK